MILYAPESVIKAIGSDLLSRAKSARRWAPSTWLNSALMGYTMRSGSLKNQLFRLVDVLPALRTNQEVANHIIEYLSPEASVAARTAVLGARICPSVASWAMRRAIDGMSKNFIAGATITQGYDKWKALRKKNIHASFDLLGEAVVSESEAYAVYDKYRSMIESMLIWRDEAPREQSQAKIPMFNFSVKLSSICSTLDPVDYYGSRRAIHSRIWDLAIAAQCAGAFMNIDMEDYRLKDLTLSIFKDLMTDPRFKSYPHFGIVVQAYLKDSEKDLAGLISLAQKRGCPFQVRLVKGAYWDYEVANAAQNGRNPPVFMSKADTDANYERLAGRLLGAHPIINSAFGTHNIRSIAAIIGASLEGKAGRCDFEFQGLYGMADEVKEILAIDGYTVRSYMPVGDIVPGMAYLVRRLLENTSNESFLRQGFLENKDAGALLASPGGKK